MSRRVEEHKDFTGGDWGRREPWNAAQNQFSATNMVLYRTGELGVRPGIRDVTPITGTVPVAGELIALSACAPTVANNVGYIQNVGGTVSFKRFQPTRGNGGVTTLTNNFAAGVDHYNYFVGSLVYIGAGLSGVYQASASTLTLLNAVDAKGIVQYGDRLVINEYTATNNNILRYNGLTLNVSDFTNWPAENVIPVGNRTEFSMLVVQRTHLMIGQPQGLYMITGALGVNENLRQVAATTKGPGASGGYCPPVLDNNELVWYFSDPNFSPLVWDGANYKEYVDTRIPWTQGNSGLFSTMVTNQQPGIATFPATDDQGVFYLCPGDASFGTTNYNSKALIRYNGAWTYHEIATNVAGQPLESAVQPLRTYALPDPGIDQTTTAEGFQAEVPADQFIMVAQTGTGIPKFYSLLFGLDRPGYSYPQDGTGYSANGRGYYDMEQAGDNSDEQVTGNVTFPEFHVKDADEILVRGVVVDFRSWDTNGTLNNHFDVQVDCLRPYDETSPVTSLVAEWDENGALSSTAGTIKRQVYMFGDQGYGNGYQVKFTNCRGIAIQRYQVIFDTVKLRGI